MTPRYWWIALCAIPTSLHAAPPIAPGFGQLEAAYGEDGDRAAATELMLQAFPRGTDLTRARAGLEAAGATCKTKRHETGALECLIHRYSLADGAADDIRWTIRIDASATMIDDIRLDRYVDRHGSN